MLHDELPLDTSDNFRTFCAAIRRGVLTDVLRLSGSIVHINARDESDYTPLCLVCSTFANLPQV